MCASSVLQYERPLTEHRMSDVVRSAAIRPETQERRSGCEFGVVIKKDDAVDDGLEFNGVSH